MRTVPLCALLLAFQPGLVHAAPRTADEIIEKSIEAAGGRKLLASAASTYSKALMEMGSTDKNSVVELWAKAPNKRLLVMNIEDFGEMKTGYDGKRGWAEDPVRGVRELTGAELAQVRDEAVFMPQLSWRKLYPKATLLGKRKAGERDAWAVQLFPPKGEPVTRYYDPETFLLVREDSVQHTPEGRLKVTMELSDYRDVDGVKAPFQIVQKSAMGEMRMRMVEVRNNIPIDDSVFAKPVGENGPGEP